MNSEASHYIQLIESVPAIPWILDWRTKRFTYVGPQVEQLLGWPRESWQTVDDWVERMHPLDRERIVSLYLVQHQTSADYESEYTAFTSKGGFVLIRDVVHIVRNADGDIESLMGFMIGVRLSKAQTTV